MQKSAVVPALVLSFAILVTSCTGRLPTTTSYTSPPPVPAPQPTYAPLPTSASEQQEVSSYLRATAPIAYAHSKLGEEINTETLKLETAFSAASGLSQSARRGIVTNYLALLDRAQTTLATQANTLAELVPPAKARGVHAASLEAVSLRREALNLAQGYYSSALRASSGTLDHSPLYRSNDLMRRADTKLLEANNALDDLRRGR